MSALLGWILVVGMVDVSIEPWTAIAHADVIVLATVQADVEAKEPSPLFRESSLETRQFSRTVTLDVLETWKGPAALQLEVDYEQLVCPRSPRFELGAPLLVFLASTNGRFTVVGMASGVRYPLDPDHRWQLAEAVTSAVRVQALGWITAPAAWSGHRRLLDEAPQDLGLVNGRWVLFPFERRAENSGERIRAELRRQEIVSGR